MITQGTPKFKASKLAPNPMEVTYWIDLNADNEGKVIKVHDGKVWVNILDVEIPEVNVDGKADKATTLAGYGITDAYTKANVNKMIEDLKKRIEELETDFELLTA